MKKFLLLMALSLGVVFNAPQALASRAVCNELGGGVIFKDTLYGLGTGLVLTGLVMAASNNGDDAGQKLALGSLAGSSVGLTFGFVEMFTRDCDSSASAAPIPGWQKPQIFQASLPVADHHSQSGYGMNFTYVLK